MKKETTIMAMPVKINIPENFVREIDFEDVFSYLRYMEEKFSTFKETSEISIINRGELLEKNYSKEIKKVLLLSKQTKEETNGYFDILLNGRIDLAGIVKGLAIYESGKMLLQKGLKNFYIEIAGDIQVNGKNEKGENWKIGIENPFNRSEIIKVVKLSNQGIATSGTYIRGKHILDPVNQKYADDIVSITVIGPNVYEADRFATAAFAMGEAGIEFLENQNGLEGYMIGKDKKAYYTTNFNKYLTKK